MADTVAPSPVPDAFAQHLAQRRSAAAEIRLPVGGTADEEAALAADQVPVLVAVSALSGEREAGPGGGVRLADLLTEVRPLVDGTWAAVGCFGSWLRVMRRIWWKSAIR
ncbi:hypothetical protein HEP84_03075 [Streptomyces sp. RLB1-33]|nr:hypothetical protein [Streptomyces sp. RLB1-33]QIY68400.1 hypothetical protein HEP84_03075 [Streptomyces sp. RLB1-33]